MKIIAIIPVRGGSKGIPHKNIKLLCGKPLLYYILKAALGGKYPMEVAISSDDDEILKIAKKYGEGRVILIKRPSALAQDMTPDNPVLKHAVKKVEEMKGYKFDCVMMLHATSPLTVSADIDGVIEKMLATRADSVVSVYRVPAMHPMKMKKIINDRLVQYVATIKEHTHTRQKIPPVYKRNGAIYLATRKMIIEDGLWFNGGICRPYLMPAERSLDIDNITDFAVAKVLMKWFKKDD